MINHHPVGKAIGFPNNYPLDSDLSGRKRYPAFDRNLERGEREKQPAWELISGVFLVSLSI